MSLERFFVLLSNHLLETRAFIKYIFSIFSFPSVAFVINPLLLVPAILFIYFVAYENFYLLIMIIQLVIGIEEVAIDYASIKTM